MAAVAWRAVGVARVAPERELREPTGVVREALTERGVTKAIVAGLVRAEEREGAQWMSAREVLQRREGSCCTVWSLVGDTKGFFASVHGGFFASVHGDFLR